MSNSNIKANQKKDEEPRVYAVKRGNGEISFTRRDFLKAAGVVTSAVLTGCATQSEPTEEPAVEMPIEEPVSPEEPAPTEAEVVVEMEELEVDLEAMCSYAKAHDESIGMMVYSPDGRYLVTSDDIQVKIWSLPEFALVKTILGVSRPSAAFSPNGAFLLLGRGPDIDVYSTTNWEVKETLIEHSNTVRNIIFIDDGRRFLSIDNDGTIIQWEMPGFTIINSANTGDEKHTRLFESPDRTMLASSLFLNGRFVHVWSLPDLELLLSFEVEVEFIISVAFSPDGKFFVAPNKEGWISVWSLPDGELVGELEAHPGELIWGLEFTPDGNRLTTDGGGETKVWSFPALENQISIEATGLGVSEDGERMITTSENEITIWSLADFSTINTFSVREEDDYWIQVSPKEDTLAVGYYELGVIEIYAIPDGKLASCLMDLASSPPEVEGIEVDVEVEGKVETYTLPCGSPIPAGAVCTCNCVAGSGLPGCTCVGHSTCSCVGHTSCSCVGHVSGGSHYWYPN